MCDMCDPERRARYEEALRKGLQEGFVKVIVELGNGNSESLWCEPVDNGLLRVCNIPFFTNVCCVDDIVEAEFDHGYRFKYLRTVERMTQGIYVQYSTDGMDLEEIKSRYGVFVNACAEHNFKNEAPMAGYAVIAVPYGEVDESLDIIKGNAKVAGLVLKGFEV